MDTGKYAVIVIAYAGDSKSASMEAIEAARKGDFETAENLLKKSSEVLLKAHEVHTKLLVNEAREGDVAISMILVHASNHFSIAEITRELAEQFVKLYKEVKNGL
ncbi:MAG TPA: PTS lactose/cellobiose transporter subunit IIA [Anaerolineaceae bacterium]|nr:PTS lactose/cellobiose transporter subunit IIA [Anaerolineaceae bacterium]